MTRRVLIIAQLLTRQLDITQLVRCRQAAKAPLDRRYTIEAVRETVASHDRDISAPEGCVAELEPTTGDLDLIVTERLLEHVQQHGQILPMNIVVTGAI